MAWRDLKAKLLKGAFDLDFENAGFGKPKKILLAMHTASQSDMLTFTSLGNGSMKRVVRIVGEEWVLAMAGDSSMAMQDMTGEVKTLNLLGTAGILVPQPFNEAKPEELIFTLKVTGENGDERDTPCFLQQFLSRDSWVEMPKLVGKDTFAQDTMLNGGVPSHIDVSVDRLARILDQLRVKEWGDFQIMYNKINGEVVVFDPLPENKSGKSFIPLVERWLGDIRTAKQEAAQKAVKGIVVSQNLRKSGGLM